jgi:DNA-binding transcriptional regulator YbjK
MAVTGVDTRERLLRAALRVIGEAGIGGVTNRAVARSAGVALGSLTYHFTSQHELLRECLLLFVGEEAERLDALNRRLEGAELTPEQVGAGVERIVHDAGRREQIAQLELYLYAARDPELREAATRCFAAYDRVARATLVALGVADPDPLVPALVALVDGYELRRLALGADPSGGLSHALGMLVQRR